MSNVHVLSSTVKKATISQTESSHVDSTDAKQPGSNIEQQFAPNISFNSISFQKANMNTKRDNQGIPSVLTTSSVLDIATPLQQLQVSENTGRLEPVARLGKNARKKEKVKQLAASTNQGTPPQHNVNQNFHLPQNNAYTSHPAIQEIFMSRIGPLYATPNSRYLENLAHHPSFQNMYNVVCPVMTPNAIFDHRFLPRTPNMPVPAFDNKTQFLKNSMQHPLLNKSLPRTVPVVTPNTPLSSQGNQTNKSPKRKNRKSKSNEESKKFEPYLNIEQVEAGLKTNKYIEGIFKINPKQFQHCYVSQSDRNEQDIFVDGTVYRNRAFEGDRVVIEILPENDPEHNADQQDENSRKPAKRGKVIYIREQVHPRICIGTLKLMPDKNRRNALFIPRDFRIPRLNVLCTSWPDNFYQNHKEYENIIFSAKILDWSDTRYAIGTIISRIGVSGDMAAEAKAILTQNELDVTPFGPEVRHLFPRLDFVIPPDEIAIREDCRDLCIFSIDPYNCRDIDDAVSCKKLANGNYEIGVHISDVSYYLTENTVLDLKVAEKATTIYMVERAYHMLPDELCLLCSLFPGADKLAFSVFWEITPEAEVLSHHFAKTVINSCSQLAYEHAQNILEGKDIRENFPEIYNNFTYENVCETVKILGGLAFILRDNRFKGGALKINQPKVTFSLDPVGLPDKYCIAETKDSQSLIEEFMLLANMTVATRIYNDHPKLAFLRCHPPPSSHLLKQLARTLSPLGIELDISSAGALHSSLLKYLNADNMSKGREMVLSMLCAKPMTRALYFCADANEDLDYQHYALNVPLYTHFTSPIRRYADIVVHRLLTSSLKYKNIPYPDWDVDRVKWIAANCNKQKYNAKKAGEMSTEVYALKYIELHSPVVTEAAVVDVRDKYIDVIIICMGLNRRIFFNNDFPGKYTCIKDEAGCRLTKMEILWSAKDGLAEVKQVVEVFSILNVEMLKDNDMVKIETKLIRPPS